MKRIYDYIKGDSNLDKDFILEIKNITKNHTYKFRVWGVFNNTGVDWDNPIDEETGEFLPTMLDGDYFAFEDYMSLNDWFTCNSDLVFMLYSGCKDVNCKEVYECDIIQADNGAKFVVYFNDGAFVYGDGKQYFYLTEKDIKEYGYKVVGNIYED